MTDISRKAQLRKSEVRFFILLAFSELVLCVQETPQLLSGSTPLPPCSPHTRLSADGLLTTSSLCPFRSRSGHKFLLRAPAITSSFVALPHPAYIFANSSLLNSPRNIQLEWTVYFQTGLRLIYIPFLHISIGIQSFGFYRDLLVFIHMVSN